MTEEERPKLPEPKGDDDLDGWIAFYSLQPEHPVPLFLAELKEARLTIMVLRAELKAYEAELQSYEQAEAGPSL